MSMDISNGVLEHFGVKGMRWGVRNDDRGAKRPSARKQRDMAIKEARKKQAKKELNVYKNAAKLPFADDRKKAARKLIDDVQDLVVGKNAKLAVKSTSGEKAVTAVLLGGLGAAAIAAISSGYGPGSTSTAFRPYLG